MFGDSPGKLRGVRSVRFFCRFVVGLASMAQSARELAKESIAVILCHPI